MFKKNKLGFKNKMRTIEEINQDYNHHAAQAGHKSRVVLEIQEEINQHLEKLLEINKEAKALPPAPPAEAPAPVAEVAVGQPA